MLGTLDPSHRKVTVVGAGIAGLLSAYELDRRGFEVTLLEAKERAGGLIHTSETEWGIVETAAHSFLATSAVTRLTDELGIRLLPVRPHSRSRYILRHSKMRRFPLTPWEATCAFLRAYFVLSKEGKSSGRATMEDWARRHGGGAAHDFLLSPFLNGVYAAKSSEISVGAAFPKLDLPPGHSLLSFQLMRWRKGLRGERAPMMAPESGMGSLMDALQARLETRLGSRFMRGEQVTTLPSAANLILAVPAEAAAGLLRPEDPDLSRALDQVRYSPLVTATVFVPKKSLRRVPRGVGVLIPEGERKKSLGVLFNSSAFPGRVKDEAKWISLTMMLGGGSMPEVVSADDAEIKRLIRDDLGSIFGFTGDENDARIFVTRQPRAIPQYSAQLMDVWESARSGWCARSGRVLFGNYTGQVSLRGMVELAAGLQT